MAKTQEELKELKLEFETLTSKLKELTDEEIVQVIGGINEFAKTRIHTNDIFVSTDNLSLLVYSGEERTIRHPHDSINVRVYMKENTGETKPRYKYALDSHIVVSLLYERYSPHGNVADGKYILEE